MPYLTFTMRFASAFAFLIISFLVALTIQAEEQTSLNQVKATNPIRVGDTISIALLEDATVRFEGMIGESGIVRLPYLKDFRITGMTAYEAEAKLKDAFEKDLYQRATPSVNIVSRAPGTVYIYGAVSKPGAIELPSATRLTVLQAISRVGGISAWANPKNCTITRIDESSGERAELRVDLEAAFRDIGGKLDTPLLGGDVIFVPAANPETMQVLSTEPCEVIVVGEINSPGIIQFAPGESRTMMRAIFKAGNFSKFAKRNAVRLVRYSDGTRQVSVVNVGKIINDGFMEEDIDLQPGDMIIVDQRLFSFTD